MLVFKKKIFRFKVKQIWYSSFINFFDLFNISVYNQIDININKSLFICEKFHTLHTDLNSEIDIIFKKFSPTVKNEIQKSKKENFILNFNESSINFLKVYNDFSKIKNLPNLSIKDLLCYGNNIRFTSISKDNKILTVHSYLIDSDASKVRLLHSANFRFSEEYNNKIISISNKYLHYNDICYFKSKGFSIYDWGGIAYKTTNKSLIGINTFKMSFGAQLISQKILYSPLYFLLKILKK